MKKLTNVKQGTRLWEDLKETRIGSREVFDIVRYYATNQELLNCGIDPYRFKDELPFVTTWALYHKIIRDGVYQHPIIKDSLSQYGLAMEDYGLAVLQKGRNKKLKKGTVYASDKLIVSLDICGISEGIDTGRQFDIGFGSIPKNAFFVCEQKTINEFKKSLPLKYLIQAQYQIMQVNAKFFILQAMVLNNDTEFERGKIVGMHEQLSKKKFYDYVKDKVQVQHIYFANNDRLAILIKECLKRFFEDVDNRKEPMPYLPSDKVGNIIKSIRSNSFYNKNFEREIDLNRVIKTKKELETAEKAKQEALREIINVAIENNCSKFYDKQGNKASFDAVGRFMVKEVQND